MGLPVSLNSNSLFLISSVLDNPAFTIGQYKYIAIILSSLYLTQFVFWVQDS